MPIRLVLALTLLAGRPPKAGTTTPAPPDVAVLRAWIREHYEPPETYVVRQFDRHDVVILGEHHKLRKDPRLVADLLAPLYARGVRHVALEFLRRTDQPLIDSVVLGATWRADLANELFLRNEVDWGFAEYRDILQRAWTLNRARPASRAPLRVLGLNNVRDPSYLMPAPDAHSDVRRALVFGGATERDWLGPIEEVVGRGGKVLAFMGIHHAFTRYRQPAVVDGAFVGFSEVRAGNAMRQVFGDRVMTIALHTYWAAADGYDSGWVPAADGWIDRAFAALPRTMQRAGFDLRDTPFGALPGETAVYHHGYTPFRLEQFADGWIIDGTLDTFEPVTPIAGFYGAHNLWLARALAWDPAQRSWTAEQFDAALVEDAASSAAIGRALAPRLKERSP